MELVRVMPGETGPRTLRRMNPVELFEVERRAMVENQLRRRGITDERVLDAMLNVPRHEFVSPAYAGLAYEDRPLPIGESQTISQPYIVAAMTQAAQVEPGDKVLEIGTGSGYQAAVLAYLGAKVYGIERSFALAQEARVRLARLGYTDVEVIWGDGSEGYPAAAPYQAILVAAASPQVPPSLVIQLAEGGRLVIPVGDREIQELDLVTKRGNHTETRMLGACQFVPLVGKNAWPEKERWIH